MRVSKLVQQATGHVHPHKNNIKQLTTFRHVFNSIYYCLFLYGSLFCFYWIELPKLFYQAALTGALNIYAFHSL